jgi:hypothetical protein
MKITSISISTALAFIVFVLFLLSFTADSNAQTLYSCESPAGGSNPFLHTINPDTGAITSTREMFLSGQNVRGCNGMAKHPQTGVCYVMVNVTNDGPRPIAPRVLGTINPQNGNISQIGGANETFATIAFTADGTLYGITGDGASNPEVLFTINIDNGTATQVTSLGNGNDGETLGFSPLDGLLYHGSGNCLPLQIFESINPQTLQITPIPLTGEPEICEQSAMVYRSGNTFLTGTIDEEFYSLTTGGFLTFLGDMDHISKGLAFDCAVPSSPVPTMSEWALIAVVIMLGLVSLIVLRRRSAFQK